MMWLIYCLLIGLVGGLLAREINKRTARKNTDTPAHHQNVVRAEDDERVLHVAPRRKSFWDRVDDVRDRQSVR